MLAVILAGLAAGSAAASPLLPPLRRPALTLAVLEGILALGILFQIHLFPGQEDRMFAIASLFPEVTLTTHAFTLFVSTLALLFIPTFCMGASFPIAIRLASPAGEPGGGVGRVYAANTVGAILGSLVAGYLLIPRIGTQNSLFLLAAVNVVCAGAASIAAFPRRRILVLLPSAVLLTFLVMTAVRTPPDLLVRSAGTLDSKVSEVIHFHEDTTCTVSITRVPFLSGTFLSLDVNGVNVAGSSPDLVAIQKLQGHLPLLVHGSAKSVLHIGFGSGGTAWAVSRHPIDRLTIAEISPEVLAASNRHFRFINHGVLDDPRVRVVINDGRNHVLATPDKYDVILSDSIHPRYAGNGSLYSEDYFRLCRERLAPGGVVSMWLPIYSLTSRNLEQILRAFVDVFPAATVWYPSSTLNPFLIVLAREDNNPVEVERFRAAYSRPEIRQELAEIGYPEPEDLLADLVVAGRGLAKWLEAVPPHVDDLPSVEYESGRVVSRDGTWFACFADVLSHRTGPAPGLMATTSEGRQSLLETARRASLRTPLLQKHFDLLRDSLRKGGPPLQGAAATLPK